MKLIPLTQGQFAQVDDEDFEYLNRWKWHAQNSCVGFYACRTNKIDGKTILTLMHRVINNTPKGKQCDHKDFNTLNNQKSNLRNCTNQENQCNKRPRKNSTSKYRGVLARKYKNNTHFIAQIGLNNEKIYLGSFKTEDEAAKAYDKKALELHGEFANINFK